MNLGLLNLQLLNLHAVKKFNSAFDHKFAYSHAASDEETITFTSFSFGDELHAFTRGFYGLEGLPNFCTKQMYSFFPKTH